MALKDGCPPGQVRDKYDECKSLYEKDGLLEKLGNWEEELWAMRELEKKKVMTQDDKETIEEEQDNIRYAIDCLQDLQDELESRCEK